MNYKLENALSNFNEFLDLKKKYEIAENDKELKDESPFVRRKAEERLKELKDDLEFSKSNVLGTLVNVRFENENDFERMKNCINYLVDNKAIKSFKSEIFDCLFDNYMLIKDNDKDGSKIFDYMVELSSLDNGFLGSESAKEILIEVLREEARSGQKNIIAESYMNDYFVIRRAFDQDDKKGMGLLKTVLKDKGISKERKAQVKSHYFEYIIENQVGLGRRLGAIALSSPLLLPALGITAATFLTGEILRLAGKAIEKGASWVGTPFDLLADKILEKGEDNQYLETLGLLVDTPSYLVNFAGMTAGGILKKVADGLEIGGLILASPLYKGVNGIFKLAKVSKTERLKDLKKEAISNIHNQFKDENPNIKNLFIMDESYNGNKLIVEGYYVVNDRKEIKREAFINEYELKDNVLDAIQIDAVAEEGNLNKSFAFAKAVVQATKEKPLHSEVKLKEDYFPTEVDYILPDDEFDEDGYDEYDESTLI